MTIRTVSQLPSHGNAYLPNGTLFEVSVPSGNKFISKKLSSDVLLNQFEDTISSSIATGFGLVDGSRTYKVNTISAAVN